jgi:hypothetical protein
MSTFATRVWTLATRMWMVARRAATEETRLVRLPRAVCRVELSGCC